MSVVELPDDLVAFLGVESRELVAGYYGTVSLLPLAELRVVTLEVTPNMAPFVATHPHTDEYGYYAVPAVNLVQSGPERADSFPAWLFLWLTVERRYGSYDLDHGDLMVFGPEVSWSQIAAGPIPYVRASDGETDGPVRIEFLEPWHRHAFVPVEESA